MDASLVSSGSAPVELSVQSVPSNVRDLGVRVTGPGMPSISKSVPLGADALVLPVPVGPAREFELRARLNELGTQQVNDSVWYGAHRRVPVSPAGALVPLNLSIRSAILVPNLTDSGVGRLVQIDDLEGTSATISSTKWSESSFMAGDISDVTVGRRGAIFYIANPSLGGTDVIHRVTALGSTPQAISSQQGYKTIAMDREGDRVYAAKVDSVWAMGLDGTNEQQLPLSAGLNVNTWGEVQGLDVGPKGLLYVAQSNRVGLFDPTSATPVASRDVSPFNIADVMVRPDGVYLLINSRDTSEQNPADLVVIRMNPQLSEVFGTFGSSVNSSEGLKGSFFGPLKFLAEVNEEITIADSDGTTTRIVQFQNVSGAGWREYGRGINGNQADEAGELRFDPYQWGPS